MLTRRSFIKAGGILTAGAVCSPALRSWAGGAPETVQPVPTPAQLAWQEAELGVLFHFDPRIFNADHGYQSLQPACRHPLKDAKAYADKFNPEKLDANQWVATAKAIGARFAILVVKHETGFCLWQSDANPFCLKNIPWRNGQADVLRDFVTACRREGIKPGIFTESRWNLQLGVYDHEVSPQSPLSQAEYNHLVEREVEELCTRYGKLFEIWFDGGIRTPAQGGPDVLPIVERHQSEIVFSHSDQRRDVRWGGTETGTVHNPCWATVDRDKILTGTTARQYLAQGDPAARTWCPAMSDAPLRCQNGVHHWLWEPGGEQGVASLAHLQEMYYGSVGRNSTLILGLTPERSGLMPAADVARCREFGSWLTSAFLTKPLAHAAGSGMELVVVLPKSVHGPVTDIVLQENIRHGERVRSFVVEVETDGTWTQLFSGSCIGQKHIQQVSAADSRRFRLRILAADGTPEITMFSLHHQEVVK